MKRATTDKITTLNPNTGRPSVRIDAAKYAALRSAILAVLPRSGPGLPFRDLPAAVEARLPHGEIPGGGSLMWYVTTVKLDLEARGEIMRVAGAKPQRLLRKKRT